MRLDVSKIRALDWAAEILARSQNAPLHVKCTDSASERAILSAVMAHMDSIEHLKIKSVTTHTSTGLLRIVEMIATNNAPSSLRFLHLDKLASLYSATDPVHEGIHRVFSAIQMPYLQTLDVGNHLS
ncbi:hypothetical protein PTI98_010100 [Pleurotus ostreatus]|uniref:Uncharacterized protein n=1 Tax=Pleurotus cornucopiae TaxID=5321 RepID=A0ACB7J2F2_PLECO|nr:hypothetical protein CCMSSC00406_0002112 [Pleurotus cornucopiae]KAJ8692822.1 hypothetical protein PTI98_010100 [Pleurotus ostreatus]